MVGEGDRDSILEGTHRGEISTPGVPMEGAFRDPPIEGMDEATVLGQEDLPFEGTIAS